MNLSESLKNAVKGLNLKVKSKFKHYIAVHRSIPKEDKEKKIFTSNYKTLLCFSAPTYETFTK